MLRWGARAAALVLAPLIGLAAYALALRVGQHGLTPERVIAAACVVVGSGFTIGYAIAAVRRGPWMQGLETTNIVAGYLALAVLILLLSPISDPARVSVADQMHRLKSGQIAADKFDYAFLRFHGARFGQKALDELAASKDAAIAKSAQDAAKLEHRHQLKPTPTRQVATYPAGRMVPDEVFTGTLGPMPCSDGGSCVVVFADLDGDGHEELAVFGARQGSLFSQRQGKWQRRGNIYGLCSGDREALARGEFRLAPPKANEFVVGGRQLETTGPTFRPCPGEAGAEILDTELVNPTPSSAPPAAPAPPAKAPPPGR